MLAWTGIRYCIVCYGIVRYNTLMAASTMDVMGDGGSDSSRSVRRLKCPLNGKFKGVVRLGCPEKIKSTVCQRCVH
eukprot:CCRYP_006731-RA/>CCRYP_006731-RA protein AED:0.00 eAED:0.00 QI:193/1/0.5/1/0/0/2/0/75